ncbi:septum formation initiator family protein [Alysiella crassa]|uniref:Cell division protein FtsB n=1 Tax=Alysiella crassa TaxID=153491 RepID=A0A376BW02_9NEIS|nr:septum formation initiator family protein [Alysiella crassa]UOP06066.1 septum formation initiator family protein [Alysiella crassa]SSY80524.1 Cell division protein FtsB [Alysiella crassa]
MKYITIGLTVIFLGLQYQIWFHKGGLRTEYEVMKQKAAAAEEQNRKLAQRNEQLKAEVKDLKNGYEAVTEMARTQLHYIQAGETFYKVQ